MPTPASEQQQCYYVARLAQQGIAHSTIKCYPSAVRHAHNADGLANPKIRAKARLEQVLGGVKSTQAKGSKQPKPRLPISVGILRKMIDQWLSRAMDEEDTVILWAAASLCFFGFSRSGEITIPTETVYDERAHLSFGDIACGEH